MHKLVINGGFLASIKGKIQSVNSQPTKGRDKRYIYFIGGIAYVTFVDLKLNVGDIVEFEYEDTKWGNVITWAMIDGKKIDAKPSKTATKASVEPIKPVLSQSPGSTKETRLDALKLAVQVLGGTEAAQDSFEIIDLAVELEEYLLNGKKK